MGSRERLDALVAYWMVRAHSGDAQPVDFRLAGLIHEHGVGGTDPAKAAVWFRLDAEHRQRARDSAAYERIRGPWTTKDVENEERYVYRPRVFDKELKNHLSATVDSADAALKLGLSNEQKTALAQYVIETFESLLSPPDVNTLHLPATPPEQYSARKVNEEHGRKENIVEFLKRVYTREIEAGIIADADLSSLDRSAYNALHNWNSLHQNEPFHLIKKQEVINREIGERLEALRQAALRQTGSDPYVTREQFRQVRRLEGTLKALLPE
jgi:hypothetical protein